MHNVNVNDLIICYLTRKIINFILFLLEINSAEKQKIINKIIFLIIVLWVTDNQLKNLII